MSEEPPSDELPLYRKLRHTTGHMFMIICDQGWRSSILCDSMYEEDADWLMSVLGRRAPRVAPVEDEAWREEYRKWRANQTPAPPAAAR